MTETSRETFLNGFYQIVKAEFQSDTTLEVLAVRPDAGMPPNSILAGTIISGGERLRALGDRVEASKSGLVEEYRIQIDIFCGYGLAKNREWMSRIVQAILGSLTTMKTTYGIFDIHKVNDTDSGPTENVQTETHGILEYTGCITRDKAD